VPDPQTMTPLQPSESPTGPTDEAWPVHRPVDRPIDRPVDWPVDRPVVRETARHLALVAMREASARGPRDTARVLDAPSAQLVGLLGHLRATVDRYVRERREAGLAVERVLPEVKGLVREALVIEGWPDSADTLMAQVVRWTIRAYYDQPEVARVSRGH
jgi:hypothetical protein